MKQWAQKSDLDGEPGVAAEVRLSRLPGETQDDFGDLWFPLSSRSEFRSIDWNTRFEVSVELKVGAGLLNGYRSPRARIFLVDRNGRREYLPNDFIGTQPPETGGWITLRGRPVSGLPVPLGFTDEGFRADQIAGVGFNFEAGSDRSKAYRGWIEIRRLRVTDRGPTAIHKLAVDPSVIADEAARGANLQARWRKVFGTASRPGQSMYGVNLAWASAVAPTGVRMQLYGSYMHAPEPYFGKYWDLARSPEVVDSVREDFREVRKLFGPQAIVRLFLFADLRGGLTLDAAGVPIGFTDIAHQSFQTLIRLAQEEQVVLMPCFFDFLMADGKAMRPPTSTDWWVGEAAHLITDPAARAGTARAIADFVRTYAGNANVLAWDVMNEPENAVAVVTPEHFADLQLFLRETVDAIQESGEIGTVGHRNPFDARDFFRGVLRTSLGQAHYYPWLETRPAPFGLGLSADSVFGAVPGGWGEIPAQPGQIGRNFTDARVNGKHRYLLFWDWRGDDETGDGFKVRAYSDEIREALNRNATVPVVFSMDDLPAWYTPDASRRLEAYRGYDEIFDRRALRGVLFVNSSGLRSSPRASEEWAMFETWRAKGHAIGNHGATHRTVSEGTWEEYWSDTLNGEQEMTTHLPEWKSPDAYYRLPNLDWGSQPEATCRALSGDLGYRVLPVTWDSRDWSYAKRYPTARREADKEAIFREAVRELTGGYRSMVSRRQARRAPADEAEVLLVHSTPFAFDQLDRLLEEAEKLGARWVSPRTEWLTRFQPQATQCVPACVAAESCR